MGEQVIWAKRVTLHSKLIKRKIQSEGESFKKIVQLMVDDQTEFFDAKQKEQDSKSDINFQKNQLKFLKQKLLKSLSVLQNLTDNIENEKQITKASKEVEDISKILNKAKSGLKEKFPFINKQKIKYLGLDYNKLKKYLCWLYQDKEEPVLVTMVKKKSIIYVYKIHTDRWISFNLGKDPRMRLNENSTFCHIGQNRLFCLTNNTSLTNFIIDLSTNKYKVQRKTIMNNIYSSCVHLNNQIFVVGALKNSECKTMNESVECYDLKSSSWRLRSNLTFKRRSPVMRVIDHKSIIVIGGKSTSNHIMPFPEIYDHLNNSWSILDMSIPLSQSNLIVSKKHNDKIIILGTKYLNNFNMMQNSKTIKLEFDCNTHKFTQKISSDLKIDWNLGYLHTGQGIYQFDSSGSLSIFDKFFTNRQLKTSNERVTMTKKSLIQVSHINNMFFPQKMDIGDIENDINISTEQEPIGTDMNFSFDQNSKLKLKLCSFSMDKEKSQHSNNTSKLLITRQHLIPGR